MIYTFHNNYIIIGYYWLLLDIMIETIKKLYLWFVQSNKTTPNDYNDSLPNEPVHKKPRQSLNILDDIELSHNQEEAITPIPEDTFTSNDNFIDYLDEKGILDNVLTLCDNCSHDSFNPNDYFITDTYCLTESYKKSKKSRKRNRVQINNGEDDDSQPEDCSEPTGISKKGKPYKSKAFIYGMAGERYVGKHIKCQRCGKALRQLRANFPGVDFRCKDDHYVQLKCTKKKTARNGNMKLMCGQFEKQVNAIKKPMGTDFMILNYSGRKVKNIKYLKNENIHINDLEPRTKDQRVVKDKQIVGFKKFKASTLNVNTSLLDTIDIPNNCNDLPLNIQFKKTIRRILDENPNMPIPEYQIESFRSSVELSRPIYYTVNLDKMTCTCPNFFYNGHKNGFQCKHIITASIRHFKDNILSIKVADVRSGKLKRTVFYTVNLQNKTCTCSSFVLNKKCKHIDKFCI